MPKKKKKQSSNTLEIQNAAKTLYANIRFMSVDDPIRSLAITSSVPNEGKSAASVNLAQAIATSGKSVLIVEADMRRRSLASMMGVHAAHGTYAVLTEEVLLDDAVVATPTQNLYFLDTEPNIPNPADLISSKRFKRLVHLLEDSYDYVIFDTPPVGTFVDAAILSTLVDATVMVARPNHVKRDELTHAYEQLQKADANVIGICATDVEGTGSEYYYAYYTNDGKRVKSKDKAAEVPAPSSSPVPSRRTSRSHTGGSTVPPTRSAVRGGRANTPVEGGTANPRLKAHR